MSNYPAPPPQTLHMLNELVGGLLGDMESVSESSRLLIENAVHDQVNKLLLYRSAVSAHKMKELTKILQGVSLCGERLSDPEYIKAIAADPTALQNHMKTLLAWEKQHRESIDKHIQGVLDRQAGVEGGTAINMYFGDSAQPVLPPELQSGNKRRRLQQAFNLLLGALEGDAPKPPEPSRRIIEAEYEVTEDEPGHEPPRGE